MRVAGINIPNEKKIVIALTYVYGIGDVTAAKILEIAKIDKNKSASKLTEEEQDKIRTIVEKQFSTEGDLRRQIQTNIKRLKDIKCFRGLRHMKHLPCRGQRTKSNSRTVRGNKRNLAISGKKPSAQKT
ncbi:MAG: 30S ribosomal protein S13 [Patescibacteria group bacterium]